MGQNFNSAQHELLQDAGLTWPDAPFRVRGLPAENAVTAYTCEEWWQAPRFVVWTACEMSLPDALRGAKIASGFQSRLSSRLDNVVRLLSGQDSYWRMYGVGFEDETKIICEFVHFEEYRPWLGQVDSLILEFDQVDEIALQFTRIDDEGSPPTRKILYKRTQGKDPSQQRVILGSWNRRTGSEIIQVYTQERNVVKTKVPPGMDLVVADL